MRPTRDCPPRALAAVAVAHRLRGEAYAQPDGATLWVVRDRAGERVAFEQAPDASLPATLPDLTPRTARILRVLVAAQAIAVDAATANAIDAAYLRLPDAVGLEAAPAALGVRHDAHAPLRLASGMSRQRDFTAALAVGGCVGVEIRELSGKAIEALAAAFVAAPATAQLFVDSGALPVYRANQRRAANGQATLAGLEPGGRAVDFDDVCRRYDALAATICAHTDDAGDELACRVRWVMPDQVGDAAASLALAARFARRGRATFRPIWPLHKGGLAPAAAFDALAAALGKPGGCVSIGLPSIAAVFSVQDLADLIAQRGDRIEAIHFLGAASHSTLAPRLAVLHAAGWDGEVSADACLLRSRLRPGSTRGAVLAAVASDVAGAACAAAPATAPAHADLWRVAA